MMRLDIGLTLESIITLSVIILSVITLSVITLIINSSVNSVKHLTDTFFHTAYYRNIRKGLALTRWMKYKKSN